MMTLTIPLPIETAATLREQAAAAGQDVASFVLEAVEEKLFSLREVAADRASHTKEARIAEWLEWTASHRALGYEVDDSRETIYSGRGE